MVDVWCTRIGALVACATVVGGVVTAIYGSEMLNKTAVRFGDVMDTEVELCRFAFILYNAMESHCLFHFSFSSSTHMEL